MNPLTLSRISLFVLLLAAAAAAKDKAPPAYRQGTIRGWNTRIEIHNSGNGAIVRRRIRVYELKGPDLFYQVDECGAFQAGDFTTGQAVEFRVDESDKVDPRIYIRHDNDKEYKCKMEGASITENEPSDDSTDTH